MDVKQIVISICIALVGTGLAQGVEWTDPKIRTDHVSDTDLILANRSGMYPRTYTGETLRQQFRAGLVPTTDPRLTDARTPLPHSQGTDTITGLDSALAGKTDTTDPRLTDARTPLPHSQGADTITGLADVAISGSYADLNNQPTIPSQSSQIAYAAGTVQDALDELFYVPISITSYTLDGGGSITRELGSSYTITAGLEWATNKAATSQTVNSVARTSPYIPAPSTVSTNQTYTLQVGDGKTTASSSRTVTFTHYRYWGLSNAASIDDAGIIALAGKEFSTSRTQSRTFTPAAEYIYVAYLATAGAALFTVNGFLDDSWVLVQRQFVNASGYSAEFRIYRSANRLTGTFSVVVT